jgi:hypothetical protein
MNDDDAIAARLRARRAYLGITDRTPTADLLPAKTLPAGLHDPDARDVAGFLVRFVRGTYSRCRRKLRAAATRGQDRYGDHELRRWDGGSDWRGHYQAPIWARIARVILDRGLDLESFVEWQFARAAADGSPYPNKLLAAAGLTAYERDEQPKVVKQLWASIPALVNHLQFEASQTERILQWTGDWALIAALRARTTSLPAFFRYWVAVQSAPASPEYAEIATTHRRRALREYASSVGAYEAAYDHPVLTDFRRVVAIVREVLADLIDGDQDRWTPGTPGP